MASAGQGTVMEGFYLEIVQNCSDCPHLTAIESKHQLTK